MAIKNLHRLVYTSQIQGSAELDVTLLAILTVAQPRNAAVDVTGALLCCGGSFLQALEGPKPRVLETYERIAKDPRHTALRIIDANAVNERLFSGWSMCGLQLSPTDAQIVQALEKGASFAPAKLTVSSALTLLVTVRQIQTRAR